MSKRSSLRVAVIGAGFGQKVHVPALRRAGAEVAAICSRDLSRARAAAEALSIPHATSSWQALCDDPTIDALAVSVPARAQPAVLEAAAAAGKHLFVEKPLGVELESARAAATSVVRAGVAHVLDFELRVVPAFVRAHALLLGGALGALRQIRASWHIETPLHRAPADHWKLRAGEGGGALHLFGSHVLDYLLWFFGPLTAEAARFGGPPGIAGDARAEAWLVTATGTPVTVSLAADAVCGSGHRLEIFGDDGTLVVENPTADYIDGFRLLHGTRGGGLVELVAPVHTGEDGRIGAVAALMRAFVAHVHAGPDRMRQAPAWLPTVEDGLRSLVLAQALRELAR